MHVHFRFLSYSTTLSTYREFITLSALMYFNSKPMTSPTLAILNEQYRIDLWRPIDMFPHTYHVENVVRLVQR